MSNVQAFKRSNVQTSNGKVSDAHASHCKRPKVRIQSMQTSNVHNNKTYTRSQVQVFELRTCIMSSVQPSNWQTCKRQASQFNQFKQKMPKCQTFKRQTSQFRTSRLHTFKPQTRKHQTYIDKRSNFKIADAQTFGHST